MKKLLLILTVLLTGCFVQQGAYTKAQTNNHSCELMDRGQACLSDHSCCTDRKEEVEYWNVYYVPTISLYYYNDLPYWGYYSGYYYYYGYRHIYPWWYYYNFLPPYYHSINTHVHCHIGNSGYVYRPRGNWRHDNKKHLSYHHNKVKNTGIKIKNNSNVPTKWRNNKIKVNKNNTRTNINRTNTKININNKTNQNNINKNNIKTNTNRSNNKVNINKSNPNKTTIKRNNSNRNNTKLT